MTLNEGTPAPVSPLVRWIPAVALVAYGITIVLCCAEEQWRPEWDSALYLLTARSLAEGSGYRYLGEAFFLRPPGFSYALTFFYGNGGFNVALINSTMMLMTALTVVAAYFALRPRYGDAQSLAAVLLMGTSQIFVARFNQIQSDMPYLMLCFASIALFQAATRERAPGSATPALESAVTRKTLLLCLFGAFLLAAAVYFRTVGVVLLPGVALWFWLRGERRLRWIGVIPLLLVALLLAPWIRYSHDAAKAAPKPAEQLRLFDYTTAIFRVDIGDPDSPMLSVAQWGERVLENATLLTASLTECILGTQEIWAQILVLIILAIGLAHSLARGPTLLEWHFLSHLVLLLFYFTFAERLLAPLLPVVYVYLVCGLCWIAQHGAPFLGGERSIKAGLLIATVPLAGLMALNLSALPERTDPLGAQLAAGTSRDEWDDYARAGAWLRENTPPDARIMTELAPIVGYHSERRVYTNRFSRGPALIQRNAIDFVVLFAQSRDSLIETATGFSKKEWVLPSHVPGRFIRIHRIDKHAVKEFLDRKKIPIRGNRVRAAPPPPRP